MVIKKREDENNPRLKVKTRVTSNYTIKTLLGLKLIIVFFFCNVHHKLTVVSLLFYVMLQ